MNCKMYAGTEVATVRVSSAISGALCTGWPEGGTALFISFTHLI